MYLLKIKNKISSKRILTEQVARDFFRRKEHDHPPRVLQLYHICTVRGGKLHNVHAKRPAKMKNTVQYKVSHLCR